MTPPPPCAAAAAVVPTIILALLLLLTGTPSVNAFGGSSTTLAISYGQFTTICSLVADESTQQIQCWRNGQVFSSIYGTSVSFDSVAGGQDTICAIRSGGYSLLCWTTPNFTPKRLYLANSTTLLESVTVGDSQICALGNDTHNVSCWRGESYPVNSTFKSISSGLGFSCGVLEDGGRIVCWSSNQNTRNVASDIQFQFANLSMANIFVGGRHVCGVNTSGIVICRGQNNSGQLDVPSNLPFEYSALALGANHTCGIRRVNNTVVCWGGNGEYSSNVTEFLSFESIVAGLDFTCGLVTSNFSVICWGPGWPSNLFPAATGLPLRRTLPGPCIQGVCRCGTYPQSQTLCSGDGNICRPCDIFSQPVPPPLQPPISPPPPVDSSPPSSPSTGLRRGLLAFAIVGSVGGFAGICSVIYCLWTGVCFGKKKIHNSVQPTINNNNNNVPPLSNSNPPSRSSTLRRQGSRLMRRQRSGTSSTKHPDRAEEFLFQDLAAATNNFSLENKIGAGSFGVVYKGKLIDGREVAIKRSESGPRTKKFQEKESAFESELAFLSRLHHKHLVRLVGYCEERDERLLVYEYMKNGALYDHLHDKNNVEKSSSLVNSWKIRIKISLDAARGIEYLHNYAVPPIIHRDIKSSNILIDGNWVARVSDFGLSLMGPESDQDFRPTKAAGTVGYIDPEYYGLNVLTAKSDVYGLGVVLLEVLTGKRAIFKSSENDGEPMSVVDYAVPAIMTGELTRILDPRVGPPELNEAEAVELVAYTAMHCVNLEGKDRPTMTDVVANLERALALCDDSHGSISSGPISVSD
ncbi:OLC1v1026813C1 [Oldenlandia corymbosa var. corymbosa]|uniref:non-specific serine/threonine protein kinase n=1 Tax=Oldenlandia corymbosa var. corymbosa TaxID=529605 RepID=A0AAV1C8I0_OLDCO|nr:OLC1v1026813C1 [Oldenlandia corymbosa var. corymbosa]